MIRPRTILLLSDANSVHTQKWALALAEEGFSVHVVGLQGVKALSRYYAHNRIWIHDLGISEGGSKLRYFTCLPRLHKIKRALKPDILHAHFATSYGLLGALVKGKTPYVISLWGDDVLIFPYRNIINKIIFKFNILRSDYITATSNCLALALKDFSQRESTLIPFGVDTESFFNVSEPSSTELVIGTIKGLEDIYGIDLLLRSFRILLNRWKGQPLKLVIVGDGTQRKRYESLAAELRLTDIVVFAGKIPHDQVKTYLSSFHVFVALSRSESFGVAVVEAMAAGKSVVVSDVGGFPEIISNGVTGFMVPSENPEAAADAIERLISDSDLRKTIGSAGKNLVRSKYEWKRNVDQMLSLYSKILR